MAVPAVFETDRVTVHGSHFFEYVYDGFCADDAPLPSPKFHDQMRLQIGLPMFVEVSVKWNTVTFLTPVKLDGTTVKLATGETHGAGVGVGVGDGVGDTLPVGVGDGVANGVGVGDGVGVGVENVPPVGVMAMVASASPVRVRSSATGEDRHQRGNQ